MSRDIVITKKQRLKNSKEWAKLLKEGRDIQKRFGDYLNSLDSLYERYGLKGEGEDAGLSREDRIKFNEEIDNLFDERFSIPADMQDLSDEIWHMASKYGLFLTDREAAEGNVLQFQKRGA